MAGLVENFIRRIEKLIEERATIPLPGTNHVDDSWEKTDVYPGELSINFSSGSLFTSDGEAIIDLNREHLLLSGLVVQKDTSGVNKLTITSGTARINGITYFHDSSGTDVLLPVNNGLDPKLYFIYGVPTLDVYGTGASGNYTLGFSATSITGIVTEPGGVFSAVAATANIPVPPDNSLLLATVLLYPGATGFDLWPRSVAEIGDYYPRFASTPSDFLRTKTEEVHEYEYHGLYFPGQFVIDEISNTIYLAKKTFVSDYVSISSDISFGNLVPLGGSGGGTGGSYSSISLGTGSPVYKTTVGTQFQFRSITGSGSIFVTTGADEITISLAPGAFITGLQNIGIGATVYAGLSSSTALIRSLTGGANVSVGVSGDNKIGRASCRERV